ncbi:MAG: hypothetical protein ABSG25_03565 [Bryobacteraceae bacterium]
MNLNSTTRRFFALAVTAFALSVLPIRAQFGNRDAGTGPKTVPGGVTFSNPASLDQSFDAVLNYLKKQGKAIESADKQIGQIFTAQERSKKIATRIMVIFIKDSDSQTTLRVAVVTQQFHTFGEYWTKPVADEQQSKQFADDLKTALKP